ncbi:MAG: ion transporter [Prolixibacteraceae bacterium]
MSSLQSSIKKNLQEIIFEADTKAGKRFDVLLFWAIGLSVLVVTLESVPSLNQKYAVYFHIGEWIFTGLFTVEYLLRIYSVKNPLKYIFSFYGLVDLLSILPSFLGLYFFTSHSLRMIRVLRLLRVFRVLKLMSFTKQAQQLRLALEASRQKIIVFLLMVVVLVVILGTLMYMIESPEDGFTSIPRSIYWAIVTLTTVGYGDITPQSVLGQSLASLIMITGYAIIAVPTGIVTAEMMKSSKTAENTQSCPACSREGHADDAVYCKYCGSRL